MAGNLSAENDWSLPMPTFNTFVLQWISVPINYTEQLQRINSATPIMLSTCQLPTAKYTYLYRYALEVYFDRLTPAYSIYFIYLQVIPKKKKNKKNTQKKLNK